MTTEQRLIDTLDAVKAYEPSPDLWDRVIHSIAEDRLHRRRVRTAVAGIASAFVFVIVIAILNIEGGLRPDLSAGHRIDWRVMQGLEFAFLATLTIALAPAIRRYGRGYVNDILFLSTQTGTYLLRLLDVAYYLVFSGYVLMTSRLAAPTAFSLFRVGDQIQEASLRVGGLLLIMGLLHAVTLMVMPLVGLVFNATRTGRKLPKWVLVILVVIAAQLAMNLPALLLVLGG